jgi:ribosome biogenesis GTPase A
MRHDSYMDKWRKNIYKHAHSHLVITPTRDARNVMSCIEDGIDSDMI